MIHEYENIDGVVHYRIFPTKEELAAVDVKLINSILDGSLIHKINKSLGPHLLTAKSGEQDYCGGPGLCKWCDGKGKGNGN